MILLLENKDERYEKNTTDIDGTNNIDIILGDDRCNTFLDSFLQSKDELDPYDVIIIHESIYHPDRRDGLMKNLKDYCTASGKKLVKYSGNNTQPYLRENLLEISAKSLYQNLKVFLDEYASNQADILMLAYGKHWRLNLLLNTLEGIDNFIEDMEEEEADFDEFEDDCDLLKIKMILGEKDYETLFENINIDDDITHGQVKQLATNLREYIQEKVDE